MHFSFVTLFPEIVDVYFRFGVVGRAVANNIISYKIFNPREYTKLKHKQVDDRPYGGGAGMLLRADVMKDTLEAVLQDTLIPREKTCVVVTAAYGEQFTQGMAKNFGQMEHLVLICGRYEGIDQRFIDRYADKIITVGPYVLSGGELPTLTIADSITRLLDGVLGNEESLSEESYGESDEPEYPQFTRPDVFEGEQVPEILLSGNHELIRLWNQTHRKKKGLVGDALR